MAPKESKLDTPRPIRRVLAVGDIHQSPNLDDIEAAIDRIAPDVTVFIGDYFDSHIYDHPGHVRRTALWLKHGIARPDRVYLLGNHDLPYAYPNQATCPGWTLDKQRIIRMILDEDDWLRFKLSYSPSPSWLFTHAGISASLVPAEVTNVPGWVADQEGVALSYLKQGRPHWMFRGGTRRGENNVGGPLWCDFSEFEPISSLNQVFGHTSAAKGEPPIRAMTGADSVNLCIDTSSHKGVQSVLLLDDEVLCNIALPMMPPEEKFDIDQILADAQTPAGRARVLREIFRSGTAVYGYDPSDPKVLIETSPNGARRRGRFFDGDFVALR